MHKSFKHLLTFPTLLLVLVASSWFVFSAPTALAAASISLSASTTAVQTGGNTVVYTISVNTGGAAAGAFQATLRYSDTYFEGVTGNVSSSVCDLTLSTPNPSGGSATLVCGKTGSSGFTGSGVLGTVTVRSRNAEGTASASLTGCSVLFGATSLSTSCSGSPSVNVTSPDVPTPTPTPVPTTTATATPPPTPAPTGTAIPTSTPITKTPTPTPSPKTKASPSPSSTPTGTPTPAGVAAEQEKNPPPTAAVTTPDVAALGDPTPIPSADEASASSTPTPAPTSKGLASAMRNVFASLKDYRSLGKSLAGMVAIMAAIIPFLALLFATALLIYRLGILERRRRRIMNRLFETQLNELAALEGKLDLLGDKAAGRETFLEEFQKAKENILRQVKKDYNEPVDGAPKAAKAKAAEKGDSK